MKYNVGETKRVRYPSYRKADGTVRMCYSPHEPDYCGFEPGIGEWDRVTAFYPNETYGYEYYLVTFTPDTENQ